MNKVFVEPALKVTEDFGSHGEDNYIIFGESVIVTTKQGKMVYGFLKEYEFAKEEFKQDIITISSSDPVTHEKEDVRVGINDITKIEVMKYGSRMDKTPQTN